MTFCSSAVVAVLFFYLSSQPISHSKMNSIDRRIVHSDCSSIF